MSKTDKPLSDRDYSQTLQSAYNEVDATISINGFLVGRIGHKVEMALSQTTVPNDTETYSFSDNGTALYSLKVIYTDGTRQVFMSAERIT